MKIGTDLEQSKKLMEFLPIESADMFYTLIDQGLYLEVKQGIEPSEDDIPAWSLGALLEIIRKNQPNYESALFVGKNDKYEYFMGYICQTKAYDDPIDACVDIVRWLYEEKRL